jgi:hypothetical protein
VSSRIVGTDLAAAAHNPTKSAPEIAHENWVRLLRGEYLEIPGLYLTRAQIQRLWDLDDVTCDAVIETLVDTRFLRQSPAGAYMRVDDCRP